jgi:hypothetical protein
VWGGTPPHNNPKSPVNSLSLNNVNYQISKQSLIYEPGFTGKIGEIS